MTRALGVGALGLWLAACRPAPEPRPAGGCAAVDADGDGVSSCTDCDDGNPTAYPGAPEVYYDGVDNDCVGGDGVDQDGDGDPALGYGGTDCDDLDPYLDGFDRDGDGASRCDGDCDDSEPLASPWHFPVCDGVDSDCDGMGDCDLRGSYFMPDDRFPRLTGVPGGLGIVRLELPKGVENPSTMVALSGATSQVLWVLPTDWQGDLTPYQAQSTLSGESYEYLDVDADGDLDMVALTDVWFGTDYVKFYPGPLSGTYAPEDAAVTTYIGAGESCCLNAWDPEGDGTPGMLVGTADADVLLGAPSRYTYFYLPTLVEGDGLAGVDGMWYHSVAETAASLSAVTDFSGNGVPDFVFYDLDTNTTYLVVDPQPGGLHPVDMEAAARIANCQIGTVAGDVNDDGWEDFWCDSVTRAEQMLLLGPITGDVDAEEVAYLRVSNTYLLPPVRVGDVNGDGHSDLAVPLEAGSVLLYLGPFGPGTLDVDVVPPQAAFWPESAPVRAWFSPGDVNGDGIDDFIFSDTAHYYVAHGGSPYDF